MSSHNPTVAPTRTVTTELHHHVSLPKPRPLVMFSGWGPRLIGATLALGIASAACSSTAVATTSREIPTIETQTVCADGAFSDVAVVNAPQAEWPESATSTGASGDVVVRVDVGASGALQRAAIVSTSGHPVLDNEAIRVARVAKYRAAFDRCKSVASSAALRVSFVR